MNPIVEKLRAKAGKRKWFGGGDCSDGYWVDPDPVLIEAADLIARLTSPAEGVELETTAEERTNASNPEGEHPAEDFDSRLLHDFDRQAAHIATLNAELSAEKERADTAEADMRTAIRAANGVASRLETELATSEAAREKAEAALREARDELALAEEVPSFTEEQRRGCIARALVAIRAALKPTGATP